MIAHIFIRYLLPLCLALFSGLTGFNIPFISRISEPESPNDLHIIPNMYDDLLMAMICMILTSIGIGACLRIFSYHFSIWSGTILDYILEGQHSKYY
jgi:hypothetical protein